MNIGKSPWDIALSTIKAIPNYPSLSIVDLGCGDGQIIERLVAEGCQARGTTYLTKDRDHIRSRDYPDHLPIDHGVDLTLPLPYESGSFDVVLCLEVIEHLEVHSVLLSEIGRILRPGGLLIMSFPNIGRMVSRLCYAVTGVHLTKERRPTEADPLSNLGSFHVRCPDMPFLHWLLWQNNLRIVGLKETTMKFSGIFLGQLRWIFNPFVHLVLRLHQSTDDAATRDLKKLIQTRAFAVGEQLVVLARKD